MHGIILKSMKDYVVAEHGQEAWEDICSEANLGRQLYLTVETYDDTEFLHIANATANLEGVSVPTRLERFGRRSLVDGQ